MKNLIKKILRENDWDWATEAIETINGKELMEFLIDNNLTEIPDHIKYVDGYLGLGGTQITSFGNLESVSGSLNLGNTPISKKYSEQEIRNMINVGGDIYL